MFPLIPAMLACVYGWLSVCLHGCLTAGLSVCLSVCLSVYLSVCLSVCMPVCLFICLGPHVGSLRESSEASGGSWRVKLLKEVGPYRSKKLDAIDDLALLRTAATREEMLLELRRLNGLQDCTPSRNASVIDPPAASPGKRLRKKSPADSGPHIDR